MRTLLTARTRQYARPRQEGKKYRRATRRVPPYSDPRFAAEPRHKLPQCEPLEVRARGARRTHNTHLGAGGGVDRRDLHIASNGGELEVDLTGDLTHPCWTSAWSLDRSSRCTNSQHPTRIQQAVTSLLQNTSKVCSVARSHSRVASRPGVFPHRRPFHMEEPHG